MSEPVQVLRRMVLSEKASTLSANLNQYTFEVFSTASRLNVARAVETAYKVEVTKVNILNIKPRVKRSRTRAGRAGTKSGYKKAIVTLAAGDKIETL